jgi:hypothetical protein
MMIFMKYSQASKVKPALAGSDDNARQPPSSDVSTKGALCRSTTSSSATVGPLQQVDSANSTSSHKDSSSDDENTGVQRHEEGEAGGGGGGKLLKLRSRRDRNRKRRRSETNYANIRPTAPGYHHQIPKIVISHTDNDVHTTTSVETDNANISTYTNRTSTAATTTTTNTSIVSSVPQSAGSEPGAQDAVRENDELRTD